MATLYGITLKGLKSFEGTEGTVYQGSLYIGNRKIAFWSQDANGAVYDYFYMSPGFSQTKLEEIIRQRRSSKDRIEASMPLEMCMTELVDLALDEKEYKKYLRKGYQTIAIITDKYHYMTCCYPEKYMNYQKEKLSDKILKDDEIKKKIEEHFFKDDPVEIKIYSDLTDFNVGNPILIDDIRK